MTNSKESAIDNNKEISEAQRAFLDYCQKFGWGKLEVTVKDGQPVMVSPIRQEIKLD